MYKNIVNIFLYNNFIWSIIYKNVEFTVVHLKILSILSQHMSIKISKQISLNMICVIERLEAPLQLVMLLPLNLRLLKVKWLYSIQTSLNTIKRSVISFPDPVSTWTREHSLLPAYTSRASNSSESPPTPTPHQSATPDTEDFSAFSNHLVLSLLGPFIPPHTFLPESCLLYCPFQTLPLHVAHLVLTDNSVLLHWLNIKGKAKREAGSITRLKELRGQFCLESQTKAVSFLQYLSCTHAPPTPPKAFSQVCPGANPMMWLSVCV